MAMTLQDPFFTFVMYFKSAEQGWSEHHYMADASMSTLKTSCKTLLDYRMMLLPESCSLLYARYSNLGGEQDSIPLKYVYPLAGKWVGGGGTPPPTPDMIDIEMSQIAVMLRIWNNQGKASTRWVHGVPDAQVSAEVLTNAIIDQVTPPPPIGDATFSKEWSVIFGYYTYQMKLLTKCGSPRRSTAGIPIWFGDIIDDLVVRGVSIKRTGRPFGQLAGRARVGA